MSQPIHHPEDDLLWALSAGTLAVPLRLIVETHLSFCARCRAMVVVGDQVGGALLDEAAPAPLAADAWSRMLAGLDAPQAPPAAAPSANDNTPAPLRAFLGKDLSQLHWRKMGPRLAYIPLYRDGTVRVRLLRGAPGADTGRHSHNGLEYTLVLAGGYTDHTGSYGAGDFQCADSGIAHNPVADDDGEPCINLSVTTDRLRFFELIPIIAGRILGF